MDGDVFIVRDSRWKLAALTAGALGFVSVGLAGLGVFGDNPFPREPGQVGRPLLWFSISLFALAGMIALKRVISPGEALRIDASGISFRSGDFVPWHHIEKAKHWTQVLRRNVFITTKQHWIVFDIDPVYESELPKYKIWLRDLNFSYSGGSHAITAIGTDHSLEEIVQGFNRFAPEELKVVIRGELTAF